MEPISNPSYNLWLTSTAPFAIASFISFSVGCFFGALWMFFCLQRNIKMLEKELDDFKKREDDQLQNYYESIH